jgi:hypothetical protein
MTAKESFNIKCVEGFGVLTVVDMNVTIFLDIVLDRNSN